MEIKNEIKELTERIKALEPRYNEIINEFRNAEPDKKREAEKTIYKIIDAIEKGQTLEGLDEKTEVIYQYELLKKRFRKIASVKEFAKEQIEKLNKLIEEVYKTKLASCNELKDDLLPKYREVASELEQTEEGQALLDKIRNAVFNHETLTDLDEKTEIIYQYGNLMIEIDHIKFEIKSREQEIENLQNLINEHTIEE